MVSNGASTCMKKVPKVGGLIDNETETLPVNSPVLSIGPGLLVSFPRLYMSQLSYPTYFFHCLNHLLSIRYLKMNNKIHRTLRPITKRVFILN